MTYLEKSRSSRNAESAGQIVVIGLLILFAFLGSSANWLNIYIRLFFAIAFCLLLFRAFRYSINFIQNEKIRLCITDLGVAYGRLFFEWDEIRELYPRGGITVRLKRRYNIGLKLWKPVQTLNELTVDKGLSHKEFNTLCDSLERGVLAKKPKIKITRV